MSAIIIKQLVVVRCTIPLGGVLQSMSVCNIPIAFRQDITEQYNFSVGAHDEKGPYPMVMRLLETKGIQLHADCRYFSNTAQICF